jgi:hypothetical protein
METKIVLWRSELHLKKETILFKKICKKKKKKASAKALTMKLF